MKWAGRAMMISAFTPIVLLIVAPVGGIIAGVTMPELWPVAGAMALVAVIALLLPLARPLPKLEPLTCVALGTKLSGGGHEQQVNA